MDKAFCVDVCVGGCGCGCGCGCIHVFCVHIHPISSTETVPKTKSSLVEVLLLGPPKLLTKVRQFVSSFRSSLEEVYRKLPLAVSPLVDFKVNF